MLSVCGIAGTVGLRRDDAFRAVQAMCDRMLPRGPDDVGVEVYSSAEATIALGSRRLSIIDLSPAGHQPMTDHDRGTTIVFNGMIYNFEDLREELLTAGEVFSSHCDTEVVLKAYGRWGARCVERLRGMFGFAIWDERRRKLFLARDRLGIKPLYYAHDGDRFLFASQVRALLASGLVDANLSTSAIQSYLSFGAVSEPLTAIEGVRALPAAHTATFSHSGLLLNRYWDFPSCTVDLGREEARQGLRELLEDAVRRHLTSDAPLGVFLSGGIDSSVLAALAAKHSPRVRTVSVVFEEAEYSEDRYIDAVARRLETEHSRISLRPADLIASLDTAFEAMDQPSFDGINTFVVARAAHQTGLKVALSGLGGDELFNGYGHLRPIELLERAARLPPPMSNLASHALSLRLAGRRREKASAWFSQSFRKGQSYELLRRLFLPSEVALLSSAGASQNGFPMPPPVRLGASLPRQLTVAELSGYTKNVLLRDTDCMSMANSLEARVPFLDHCVVEWALGIPPALAAEARKGFLVDAMREYLPAELLGRPKQGFVLPVRKWMQNELRNEIEKTLLEPPKPLATLLEVSELGRHWKRFLAEGGNWLQPWSLYALCRWTASVCATA